MRLVAFAGISSLGLLHSTTRLMNDQTTQNLMKSGMSYSFNMHGNNEMKQISCKGGIN